MKNYFIIFLIIMAVGLGVYFTANRGWYPLVIVNSKPISARTLIKQSEAATRYYTAVFQSGDLTPEVRQEIERATLDKLIENAIVYKELQKQDGDFEEIVSDKITALNLDKERASIASIQLYGLNFDEFSELVLLPMARREVLMDHFSKKGNFDFGQWLGDIKSKAKVTLLTTKFRWDGGKVELNK